MEPHLQPRSFRDVAAEFVGPPLPGQAGGSSRDRRRSPDLETPVTFAGTTGFFTPGEGSVAVLMLGAVGYEELCLRVTWRSLAGLVAATGTACLRFDYPGTADAPDPDVEPRDLADWKATVVAAAGVLRAAAGVERLVLVGQGLGGALAASWAAEIGGVEGCVLMAPVVSGRRHLRELSIWSRMVTDRIGIGPDPDDLSGCAVGGFILPAGRAAAIRTLDLARLAAAPAAEMLLVERSGHAGDAAFATHLGTLGARLTRIPYAGYERLTTDPTAAVPPVAVLEAVADWVARLGAAVPVSRRRAAGGRIGAPSLVAAAAAERPLRFGPGGRLFGILCGPAGARPGTAVVLVNAGRDYHIGWGRATVDQARAFARLGLASLRFDAGGIGDSPAGEDAPAEVLYSASLVEDVRAAVDLLEAEGYREIVVLGRCSGAHAAFNAAVADARIARVVLVNIERFVWDPDENIAEALRYGHRSLGDFGATLKSRDGLKRLLTGRLRVRAAGLHLAQRFLKAASFALAPVAGGLTGQGRLYREVHRGLAELDRRGVAVALVFAEGDLGLAEADRYLGSGRRRLARYPNMSLRFVAEADHNFTHVGARRRLLDVLSETLAP